MIQPNRFFQSDKPSLDDGIAQRLLENVFEACDMETNTIPLNVLSSYSNYRKERFALQKLILIFFMTLFVLLPVLFVPPSLSLRPAEDSPSYAPEFSLDVQSYFLPIDRVTAVIDGHNVPVYETDVRSFAIQPNSNGLMTVTVTLANNQYQTQTIEVKGFDRDAPSLLSHALRDGKLYLKITDGEGSGLDLQHIRAIDENGDTVKLLSYDEETQELVFDYTRRSMNLFIPDLAGNNLQLVLTVR